MITSAWNPMRPREGQRERPYLLANLSFPILSIYSLVLTERTSPEKRINEMTANDDFDRFGTGATKYAAYLETPEGRLRLDLAFANLQDFFPRASTARSSLALDLGRYRLHSRAPGAAWPSRYLAA